MKNLKKMMALVIAMVMTLILGLTAFADETNTTVSTAASKGSGAFTITMQSAEDNHTFKAYRIFDGSVNTDGILGDISWAEGFNTGARTVGQESKTLAEELAAAGLPASITEGGKTVTLDLSNAPDVAKALTTTTDDSTIMKAVADVFYARRASSPAATVSAKTGNNYVLGNGAEDSGNAPLVAGYYLVTDEYTSAPAAGAATLSRNILAVVGDVTAKVKNTKPSVEKKILDPSPVDANKAGIGDTVAYQITGAVPNYEGYVNYFYVINDTLSNGLTFDGAQNVVVTVGEGNEKQTLTQGTDYLVLTSSTTPAATSGHSFEIAFKKIKTYTIGAPIVVTYTATVNANAAIGTPGNPNTTDVTYSNKPNESSGGNPEENPKPTQDIPTGTSAPDKTVTYVAELDLTKYKDAVNSGNLLAGATFTLTGEANVVKGKGSDIFEENTNGAYWKLTDNTYTTTAPHGDIKDADGNVKVQSNESYYASTTQKYALKHVTEYEAGTEQVFMQGTSDQDGKIVFKGPGAGTYTLTEVVTPTGYNTADPIRFTVTITVPGTISTGDESATFSVTNANPAGSVTVKADTAGNFTTGVYQTDVIDKSGSTLPSTGGMGTTIFYVLGAILVIGAAVVLVTRRRMKAE